MNAPDPSRDRADKRYQFMWWIGAWHNFIGCALFAIFGLWVYTREGLDPPVPGVHYQTWVGLIFVFGVGYYRVYLDMFNNKTMVIVGILGKFVSASPMLYGLLTHNPHVPKMFVVPVFTDMSFGVLFVMFYVYATRNNRWKVASD